MEEAWAALLTRMRPTDAMIVPPEPGPLKHNKRKSDPPPVERPQVEERDVTSVQVVDMPANPGEILKRSQIVECLDMKAKMRELALTQSRAAIDLHGHNRLLNQLYMRVGLGLACFLVTTLVLTVSSDGVLRAASLLSLTVGVYLAGTGLVTARRVLDNGRNRRGGLRAVFEQTEIVGQRRDLNSQREANQATPIEDLTAESQGEA